MEAEREGRRTQADAALMSPAHGIKSASLGAGLENRPDGRASLAIFGAYAAAEVARRDATVAGVTDHLRQDMAAASSATMVAWRVWIDAFQAASDAEYRAEADSTTPALAGAASERRRAQAAALVVALNATRREERDAAAAPRWAAEEVIRSQSTAETVIIATLDAGLEARPPSSQQRAVMSVPMAPAQTAARETRAAEADDAASLDARLVARPPRCEERAALETSGSAAQAATPETRAAGEGSMSLALAAALGSIEDDEGAALDAWLAAFAARREEREAMVTARPAAQAAAPETRAAEDAWSASMKLALVAALESAGYDEGAALDAWSAEPAGTSDIRAAMVVSKSPALATTRGSRVDEAASIHTALAAAACGRRTDEAAPRGAAPAAIHETRGFVAVPMPPALAAACGASTDEAAASEADDAASLDAGLAARSSRRNERAALETSGSVAQAATPETRAAEEGSMSLALAAALGSIEDDEGAALDAWLAAFAARREEREAMATARPAAQAATPETRAAEDAWSASTKLGLVAALESVGYDEGAALDAWFAARREEREALIPSRSAEPAVMSDTGAVMAVSIEDDEGLALDAWYAARRAEIEDPG
eukprot:gene21109-27997_t